MVACLFSVSCLEFGSIGWPLTGGGGVDDWPGWAEPWKLAERLTFLEEMVMEEKPALFWGMRVVTAELVWMCDDCNSVGDSGAVALRG